LFHLAVTLRDVPEICLKKTSLEIRTACEP